MTGLLKWLRTHKFEAHLIVLALLIVPPIPLYYAARNGAVGWIWALLCVVILGNILVLFVR
jgi:predicted ABC-type exoprotein transport system permease subunit